MDTITIGGLEGYLAFFRKMYDVVRIVDPIEKRVVECAGACFQSTNDVCFEYWRDGRICDNCISVRAFLGNKCYMKLEKSEDAIMIVTALPVESSPTPAVIELLKNATETMMIGMGIYSDGHMMRDYIKTMNEQVTKDELTGIYNRRYVDERLPVDIVKSVIDKQPLCIVFLDIDNLKEINDTFGHAAGDTIIQNTAIVLDQHIRVEQDWVARYGGDEFIICLNNTSQRAAIQICERIREQVRKPVESANFEMRTSVSVGLYTMSDTPLTAKELIALADERMYMAKQRGKDQISFE